MKYIIRNGTVYSGALEAPKRLDILINNGIIEKMGKDLIADGVRVIDATGLIVSPGWIDSHSHNDFFVANEEALIPFIKQGITTQVVGNCGFSAYGVEENNNHQSLVGGGLFQVDRPMSLSTWMKTHEKGITVNMVPLIGHGTARIGVNGYHPLALTSEELEMLVESTKDAMEAGAFGGSLGLMYEPGIYASTEELIAFATVIASYDGVLTVHPRASSKIALGYPLFSKPHIEIALDEVIEVMKKSGVKTVYSHLILVGKATWKCINPMLSRFEQAVKDGYEFGFDLYPYMFGASVITVILPAWYMGLSKAKRNKPWNLFKLKTMIAITKKLLGVDFSDMIIAYIGEGYAHYEGKTVSEIASEENCKPIDAYLKLVDLSNGKGRILFGKYSNEEITRRLMEHPQSVYMTDAWFEEKGTQNPATFQSFPLFIKKAIEMGLPLEHAIHKMTGKTANRYQLHNRGYIKEGYHADLTIIDLDNVAINEKETNSSPDGIAYVFINGTLVYEQKEIKHAKAGIVLKRSN